jgi:hypothetical protein
MTAIRSQILDIFRGIVIVDMIIMHFSNIFPKPLGVFIEAFDFAIEGFILLAGFMIGRHYLQKYHVDKWCVSKRLFLRAIKIIAIQYLLILTVSLPFYAYFYYANFNEVINFATSSFLFLNQVPIIHILPTFIPLFLLSPLILSMLANNKDHWLLVISFGIFLLGMHNPYSFSISEKTIFPILLWQIYFIVGCIIGKRYNKNLCVNNKKFLLVATILLCSCLLMKYGGYFSVIQIIKTDYNIYPKKFPLNLYGLLYGASLLIFSYAFTIYLWVRLENKNRAIRFLSLLGRYSLTVFFVHTYLVYLIRALTIIGVNEFFVYGGIIMSFYVIYTIVVILNHLNEANSIPSVYRWLFL